MDQLKIAIEGASDIELAELSSFLLAKFKLNGHRVEEDGWGWDLDANDVVAAMREFAASYMGDE